MSKMTIEVKILPGTRIEDAIEEALEKSKAMDLNISFDFNGRHVFVAPYSDPVDVLERFNKARSSIPTT